MRLARVQGRGQGAVAELVVAAAVRAVVATAALGADARGVGGDVGGGHAAPVHVVVVDQLPDRPVVAAAGRRDDRLVHVVAVVVGRIRDVVAEVVDRDVLRP